MAVEYRKLLPEAEIEIGRDQERDLAVVGACFRRDVLAVLLSFFPAKAGPTQKTNPLSLL